MGRHRPTPARSTVARLLVVALLGSILAGLPSFAPLQAAPVAPPAAPLTGHIDEFAVSSTGADPLAITGGQDGKLWFADGNPSAGKVGSVDATGAVNEYPVFAPTAVPTGIVAGSNGNLWFTEQGPGGNDVGQISTGGSLISHTNLLSGSAGPRGVVSGPPGDPDAVWVAEFAAGKIARVPASGAVSEFGVTNVAGPNAITVASDSNLWFTERGSTSYVGKITTAGTVTEYAVTTTAGAQLGGITQGADGNIWFTMEGIAPGTGHIGRIGLNGTGLAVFATGGNPMAITSGLDGHLWFTDAGTSAIGELGTDGALVNEFSVSSGAFFLSSSSDIGGITTGPDGNIWFTEQTTASGGAKVGRLLVQPVAAAIPAAVDFGTQGVLVTSTQSVTVKASAGGSATITAAPAITGPNAGDFSINATNCLPGTVLTRSAPTCTIALTFDPPATGPRQATLTLGSTALNSTTTIALTGAGALFNVSAFPTSLAFTNQVVGTTSTVRAIALVNAGPGTLSVSAVAVTPGSDFSIVPGSDTCSGHSVAAQGFCTVGVVFAPTAEGLQAAALQFTDNATPPTQSVLLTGRGVSQVGYWLSASDGGVFSFGAGAAFHGSTGSIKLNKPIVGIAATADSQGYWEVATDGGIFAFGDAAFFGSTGSITLNKPIVGMAATPTGQGYWLVASDGGIFAFGDAKFFGSTGSITLNKPIVGMAATPTGQGYWLVASDGGIFAFGDAKFQGSTGSIKLNKPIVGMATTVDGSGYWLVASDGGIFSFNAPFLGSTGSIKLNKPIVGMSATPTGQGYWLVATDGGIFAFPDAKFFGSTGSIKLNQPIVGMAPAL